MNNTCVDVPEGMNNTCVCRCLKQWWIMIKCYSATSATFHFCHLHLLLIHFRHFCYSAMCYSATSATFAICVTHPLPPSSCCYSPTSAMCYSTTSATCYSPTSATCYSTTYANSVDPLPSRGLSPQRHVSRWRLGFYLALFLFSRVRPEMELFLLFLLKKKYLHSKF